MAPGSRVQVLWQSQCDHIVNIYWFFCSLIDIWKQLNVWFWCVHDAIYLNCAIHGSFVSGSEPRLGSKWPYSENIYKRVHKGLHVETWMQIWDSLYLLWYTNDRQCLSTSCDFFIVIFAKVNSILCLKLP